MKRILNSTLLITVFFFSACTDVIDLEVPTEEAKLVIEASINWEKETSGSDQTIYLSKSTPFFDTNGTVPVVGASVVITNNNDGSFFEFNDQNDGSYTTSNFIPVLNDNYTLEVMSEGETYNAQETFVPVVPILEVYQSTEKFLPEVLEVNFDFLDPVEEENYYYIKFKEQADTFPRLLDFKDEFVNGNLITVFNERQENEDINQVEYAPGDTVNMELIGISKRYYEYIQLLINQSESGGPFDTTPVALRGNCTNQNDPNNFAHGYFRLTEVAKASYTFE
ncbi:MAG: DUF4249 domain-containing protein [Flavobacteriaceae bacterium]|nr:DUF4249 domain-containing protein [Flavobacteriaceae bacterium]